MGLKEDTGEQGRGGGESRSNLKDDGIEKKVQEGVEVVKEKAMKVGERLQEDLQYVKQGARHAGEKLQEGVQSGIQTAEYIVQNMKEHLKEGVETLKEGTTKASTPPVKHPSKL